MSKVYLFFGDEKYDLNQRKEFNNLELGINLFYIDSNNIQELPNVFEEVSFFGSQKLVIIRDTKLKFDVDIITKNENSEITIIIVEDSIDKRTTQYKTLQKIAEIEEFKTMDSYKAIEYIIKTLKLYNVTISKENATYMESICADDKTNIINELQKLVNYLDDEKVVTKEIIDKVCSKTFNSKIFDLLDDIVRKNKNKALDELQELLNQKEPIVKIYIMLYKQIKQLYLIKLAKNNKVTDVAKYLKINPYVYNNLSRVTDSFSLADLKKIIYIFDDYDEKTKIGEMDFELGLKKIILSM